MRNKGYAKFQKKFPESIRRISLCTLKLHPCEAVKKAHYERFDEKSRKYDEEQPAKVSINY